MARLASLSPYLLLATLLLSCSGGDDPLARHIERPPAPPHEGIHGFAQGCYAIDATDPGSTNTRWLRADATGEGFAFDAESEEEGARFFLKASDLGTYLFYDAEGRYLVDDEGTLGRREVLASDITTIDDSFVSPAEWFIEVSASDAERFQVRNRRTDAYLTIRGSTDQPTEAGVIAFYPTDGCADFPELTLDASGEVAPRTFDDGDVWGIADTHSHMLTNFGFGGGGIFHGSPFHRLGVEHALPDCTLFHGPEGRADLIGFGYDQGGDFDPDVLIAAVVAGRLAQFNHNTEGYPDFTDWPNAPSSATHQNQYYKWLERAYLGGLRLVVQHATGNSVICELTVGVGAQDVRYSCNDMVSVDRQLDEVVAMERYIDAQEGGPGQGWFRIVRSPEEARAVISEGKLAVVLGIEISNLFDCNLTPEDGTEPCTEASVTDKLDYYRDLGVRVLFPVHKYDNAFSAGDGSRGIIELGNWINSGHWSNFIDECPDLPSVFDKGDVTFGGINMPREEYVSEAPVDMSGFPDDPFATLSAYIDQLTAPPLEGDYCQRGGLTALGERLIDAMMDRGMVLEIDHFPRRSYERAFEILEANDYPAAGTHGVNLDGRIYALGGVSKTGLGRCADPDRAGAMLDRMNGRIAQLEAEGAYPAEGFGFDFNGFAGAAGARFGENSRCSTPQENPVTYPFESYDGTVTFTEPRLGNRVVDFNTEGMVHVGLLPELLEDVRRDGATDADLEPLFRSAEAYIRMWERSEERGRAR